MGSEPEAIDIRQAVAASWFPHLVMHGTVDC
jgi:hypothetical protein